MLNVIYVTFFSILILCQDADADTIDQQIAAGFERWSQQSGNAKTALSYAQHLAKRQNEQSQTWARAIIYQGRGFGGFQQGQATQDEIAQYMRIICALKSASSTCVTTDGPSQGGDPFTKDALGRPNMGYHQSVLSFLEAGVFSQQDATFPDAECWRQCYVRHTESGVVVQPADAHADMMPSQGNRRWQPVDAHADMMPSQGNRSWQPVEERAHALYLGALASVPHVHPYGDGNVNTPVHRAYVLRSQQGPLHFINCVQEDNGWRGHQILFRPHAYLGRDLLAGAKCTYDITAHCMTSAQTRKDVSGRVQIHDNVASPNNMPIMSYEEWITCRAFVTHLAKCGNKEEARTLHVLVPIGLSMELDDVVDYLTKQQPGAACWSLFLGSSR